MQEGVLRHKERRRKRRRQLMPKRRAVAEVKIENRETPEIAIGPVTKADVADVEVATADAAAVVDDDQNTEQKRT